MIGIQGKRMNTSQSGFSLVELMVVVAIIGALAMVAVPRVNRFIAKARTSEAQVNLSSIYTFNKNFLVEFQGFTSSLTAMGYRPEGDLRYNIGFTAGATVGHPNWATAVVPNRAYAAATGTTNELCAAGVVCRTKIGNNGAVPPANPTGAAAPAGPGFQTFTAAAEGSISSGGLTDRWTINENKLLQNTQDGTN